MDANQVIQEVINRHSDNNINPIQIYNNLHLEPKLNYSGKMAREAYQGFYKGTKAWNGNRGYCGILDIKIMNKSKEMEHSRLLKTILESSIPLEALRKIYLGQDALNLDLQDQFLQLASEIQCTFMEQELNWGVHDFQLRTHYGYPDFHDPLLKNAVPRDFLMTFIERGYHEINQGQQPEVVWNNIIEESYKQTSAVAYKPVLTPFIEGKGNNRKVMDKYREFVYSNNVKGVKPWVHTHLEEIGELCRQKGPNPNWKEPTK